MKLAVTFLACCIAATQQQLNPYGLNYYPYWSWVRPYFYPPTFHNSYGPANYVRRPYFQQRDEAQVPFSFTIGDLEGQDQLKFRTGNIKEKSWHQRYKPDQSEIILFQPERQWSMTDKRANLDAVAQAQSTESENGWLSPADNIRLLYFDGLSDFFRGQISLLKSLRTSTSTSTMTSTFTLTSTYQCFSGFLSSYYSSLTPCRRKRMLLQSLNSSDFVSTGNFKSDNVNDESASDPSGIIPSKVSHIEPTASSTEMRSEQSNIIVPTTADIESSQQASAERDIHYLSEHRVGRLFGIGEDKVLVYATSTSVTRLTKTVYLSDPQFFTCRPNFIHIC